jgi:dTDP-glucose pyrophosphorylase
MNDREVKLENLAIGPDDTLRDAIEQVDRNGRGAVLVLDPEHGLLDVITDGDLRRAVIAGTDLETPVEHLAGRRESSPYREPVTAALGTDRERLLALLREHSVRQIPLLDAEGRVADLVTLEELVPEPNVGLEAVIVAGGRGTRLRPLTDRVPKPMLPIGDRPLLQYTVERLRDAGVPRVHIATHYRGEQIEEHFGDGERFGVDVRYLAEPHALGTAGSLSLLETSDRPILVINGDVLTSLDVRAMFTFHREQCASLTVAARPYRFEVPYGVLRCEGSAIKGITEKPGYHFFVNAGVYLLEPDALDLVPGQRASDMTELLERLLTLGRRVASFPLVEYWMDVGRPGDYEQAQEDVKNGRFLR